MSSSSLRRIPASGINLFQLIYILIREYEEKSGEKCLNLSLGNPDLIPNAEVLKLKARFAADSNYDLHTYAEDKNLNGFVEGMVEACSGLKLTDYPQLRATTTAGIKTATAILPLACGMHLKGREKFSIVSHLPAYDMIGTWGASYLGSKRIVWPLRSSQGMRMDVESLKQALERENTPNPDLIFVIRPGNPASAGASKEEWISLCELAQSRGSRLVNDGAYATLTDGSHVTLASVAKDFPKLEWAELYSVSKSFSDPGQRLGVFFGSKEFVEDFTLIKGNTDSGPVPLGMIAYGELFKDQKKTRALLDETYGIYRKRLEYLVPKLKSIGLLSACETTSGFFTLWKTPKRAFGLDLESYARERGIGVHEAFNRLVIEKCGIVGVHFQSPALPGLPSESFIRYAVCTDVLSSEFQRKFESRIQSIRAEY